jgi:hypothetical protein
VRFNQRGLYVKDADAQRDIFAARAKTNSRLPLPLFSFVAIAVALVGQVASLSKARPRATSAYLFLAVVPSLVVLALYLPTLELMWKAW